MIFDLVRDFADALAAMPKDHERQRVLKLLDEAIRREIHFIAEHRADYPQALFQTAWNHGWWHDSPEMEPHYEGEYPPVPPAGPRLYELLESWRRRRTFAQAGTYWLRSLRPPVLSIDSPLRMILLDGADGVAFSPDGLILATGGHDGSLRLWEASTGRLLMKLTGHAGIVRRVAFSPDGDRIVTASLDGTACLWDARSGTRLGVTAGHRGMINDIAYSADGGYFVTASDHSLKLWDSVGATELATLDGHRDEVQAVACAPGGAVIASGSHDGTLNIWDVRTRRVTHSHSIPYESGSIGCRGIFGIKALAYSADGAHLLFAHDDTVWVSRCVDHSEDRGLYGHKNWVECLAVSPDGKRVATGGFDGAICVWNLESGEREQAFDGRSGIVMGVAFAPDGKTLASVARSVHIWDADSDTGFRRPENHAKSIECLEFSPDGRWVVSGSADKTLRIWNSVTGRTSVVMYGHGDGVTMSPDGKGVVAVAGPTDDVGGTNGKVTAVAFSGDGAHVASGSDDCTIRLWDATTGQLLAVLGRHQAPISCVTFSDDRRYVASGAEDGSIGVWDIVRCAAAVGLARFDYGTLRANRGTRLATGSAYWSQPDANSHEYLALVASHLSRPARGEPGGEIDPELRAGAGGSNDGRIAALTWEPGRPQIVYRTAHGTFRWDLTKDPAQTEDEAVDTASAEQASAGKQDGTYALSSARGATSVVRAVDGLRIGFWSGHSTAWRKHPSLPKWCGVSGDHLELVEVAEFGPGDEDPTRPQNVDGDAVAGASPEGPDERRNVRGIRLFCMDDLDGAETAFQELEAAGRREKSWTDYRLAVFGRMLIALCRQEEGRAEQLEAEIQPERPFLSIDPTASRLFAAASRDEKESSKGRLGDMLTAAEQGCRRRNNERGRLIAREAQAIQKSHDDDRSSGEERVRKLVDEARVSKVPDVIARGLRRLAGSLVAQKNVAGAEALLDEAVAICEAAGDANGRRRAVAMLAAITIQKEDLEDSDVEKADKMLAECEAPYRAADDIRELVPILIQRAVCRILTEDDARAEVLLGEALAHAERIRHPALVVFVLQTKLSWLVMVERQEEARDCARDLEARAAEAGITLSEEVRRYLATLGSAE